MVNVRGATVADVPWMLSELRNFAKFWGSAVNLFPKDDEYARKRLAELVEGHLALVAEGDDFEPQGFIVALVGPHFYNPELMVLTEAFWWVVEKFRGGSAGLRLLRAMEDWAQAHEIDLISMTLEAKSPVNPDCLTRRGYALQERSFIKVVNPVEVC